MAAEVAFSLLTPGGLVAERSSALVVLPGLEGQLGILFGHMPMVVALRAGRVTLYDAQQRPCAFYEVGAGFADITPDGLTVLTETAQEGEENSEMG